MRLIDADNIYNIGDFVVLNEDGNAYIPLADLCKLIDIQPTTYDVDKVVEQLEEVKKKNTEIALDDLQKERCFWYKQAMDKAIEIVKRGGINE